MDQLYEWGGNKCGGKATIVASKIKYKTNIMSLVVSGIYKYGPEPMPYSSVFPYVTNLYLSKKQWNKAPKAVLEMKHIVKFDLSDNFKTYFNQIPVSSDTTQKLLLTKNSPPSSIWKHVPSKLKCLDFSGNNEVVSILKDQRQEDNFDYYLDIYRILLVNCSFHTCKEFLYTLCGVKGGGGYMTIYNGWKELIELPLNGITCYGSRIINLNNCQIYDIHESITDYNLVAYLDLGVNYIARLPEEFGYLTDLEICILSSNKLENLPDSIINLKKLRILFLSNNKIECLPENLFSLPKLKCVDLYDNCVDTLPNGHENMDEFDFAQNYASEPEQSDYTEKRNKLRNKHFSFERINEKKIKPDDESDREGSPAHTCDGWDELPFFEGFDSSEEEFAEQLGFEYVTKQHCEVDNASEAAQSEDEFVLLG